MGMHGMNRLGWAALAASTMLATALPGQTPALQAGVSVQMATTRHGVALPAADQAGALVVAVTAGGNTYLGVTRVTAAELTARLKSERQAHPQQALFVKVDARTGYGALAEDLVAIRSAGFRGVALLTAQPDTGNSTYPVPPKGLEVSLVPTLAQAAELGLEPGAAAPALLLGGAAVTREQLQQQIEARRWPAIALRAAGAVNYQAVVNIIDLCASAKLAVTLIVAGN